MFNPCFEYCKLRYNREYTSACDTVCDYAAVVKENERVRGLLREIEKIVRCRDCKFHRPLDRTKSPEKYFKDDFIVCECEDVVGDEPMVYPKEHYCSFGKVDDGC